MKLLVLKKKPCKVCKGKCSTLYCGDCAYFNYSKTSFGRNWCGYYKSYTRVASDIACSHFVRG